MWWVLFPNGEQRTIIYLNIPVNALNDLYVVTCLWCPVGPVAGCAPAPMLPCACAWPRSALCLTPNTSHHTAPHQGTPYTKHPRVQHCMVGHPTVQHCSPPQSTRVGQSTRGVTESGLTVPPAGRILGLQGCATLHYTTLHYTLHYTTLYIMYK